VFSSITADDLDLARAGGRGVAAFKAFLHYAQTGILDVARPSGRAAGSPFEEQVAAALAGLGHEVEAQIGIAGIFVDLAIRDRDRPGRYLLGIECDGADYHGARSARDRDRLRQQVLEDRGWIIHRIWSIDWHRHPERELGRVQAAIDEARAIWAARDRMTRSASPEPLAPFDDIRQAVPGEPEAASEGHAVRAARDRPARPMAPEASGKAREASPAMPCEPEDAGEPTLAGQVEVAGEVEAIRPVVVPYQEAELELPGGTEPDLLPLEAMVDAVRRVVQIEGPVHEDEIARRVARACGRERAGRRIAAAIDRGLAEAVGRGILTREGSFYQPADGAEPRVRDRSEVRSATLRRPDMVPPSEIRAAAMRVIIHAELDALPAEIAARIARMLGLRTTSVQLRSARRRSIACRRAARGRDERGRSRGAPGERRLRSPVPVSSRSSPPPTTTARCELSTGCPFGPDRASEVVKREPPVVDGAPIARALGPKRSGGMRLPWGAAEPWLGMPAPVGRWPGFLASRPQVSAWARQEPELRGTAELAFQPPVFRRGGQVAGTRSFRLVLMRAVRNAG